MQNDEKMDFMQMLSVIRVVDDDDHTKEFKDCIEKAFSEVTKKVTEYKRDGSLVISMKFVNDKKNKNTVNVYAEVKKNIPKGMQANPFYSDMRTGGLYFDDPQQLNWIKMQQNKVTPISNKDDAAQNNN